MGGVRLPPSENARDVAVVPSGATKTIYLIRHAEGFHNQAGEVDPVRVRCARLIGKRLRTSVERFDFFESARAVFGLTDECA